MITAGMVKELRERTGAGMMDCKKALTETNGDMDKAIDYLREKGLAAAAKKSGRVAAEGLVESYIHGAGKIGVMIEVASDNVNDAVKTFAQDVCLHIAALNPMAISSEAIPSDVVAKEKEILTAKNLESGKKPEMVEKIVEGQIRKFLAENCLVDQPFVKNPDIKVGDLGKQVGATIKRFVRFELGAGIEKKVTDFAAEVAEQMKGH